MPIKRERPLDGLLAHHSERNAVRERVALVRVLSEEVETLPEQHLINMHNRHGATGKQALTNFHSFGVKAATIEK